MTRQNRRSHILTTWIIIGCLFQINRGRTAPSEVNQQQSYFSTNNQQLNDKWRTLSVRSLTDDSMVSLEKFNKQQPPLPMTHQELNEQWVTLSKRSFTEGSPSEDENQQEPSQRPKNVEEYKSKNQSKCLKSNQKQFQSTKQARPRSTYQQYGDQSSMLSKRSLVDSSMDQQKQFQKTNQQLNGQWGTLSKRSNTDGSTSENKRSKNVEEYKSKDQSKCPKSNQKQFQSTEQTRPRSTYQQYGDQSSMLSKRSLVDSSMDQQKQFQKTNQQLNDKWRTLSVRSLTDGSMVSLEKINKQPPLPLTHQELNEQWETLSKRSFIEGSPSEDKNQQEPSQRPKNVEEYKSKNQSKCPKSNQKQFQSTEQTRPRSSYQQYGDQSNMLSKRSLIDSSMDQQKLFQKTNQQLNGQWGTLSKRSMEDTSATLPEEIKQQQSQIQKTANQQFNISKCSQKNQKQFQSTNQEGKEGPSHVLSVRSPAGEESNTVVSDLTGQTVVSTTTTTSTSNGLDPIDDITGLIKNTGNTALEFGQETSKSVEEVLKASGRVTLAVGNLCSRLFNGLSATVASGSQYLASGVNGINSIFGQLPMVGVVTNGLNQFTSSVSNTVKEMSDNGRSIRNKMFQNLKDQLDGGTSAVSNAVDSSSSASNTIVDDLQKTT